MGGLAKIKQDVIDLLNTDHRFRQLELTEEFPGDARAIPVKKGTLAVGIDRVEAVQGGLGGHLGFSDGQVHSGALAEVTVRFDFYFPRNEAGSGLHVLFEGLCELLLLSGFGVEKLWCEPIGTEKGTISTRLSARAALRVCLERSEETAVFRDIEVKGVAKW